MLKVSPEFVTPLDCALNRFAASLPDIDGTAGEGGSCVEYNELTRRLMNVTGDVPGLDASVLFAAAQNEMTSGVDGGRADICERALYNAVPAGAMAGKGDCISLLKHINGCIFGRDGHTVYVNLFIASSLRLPVEGGIVCLHMRTDYPAGGVRVEIEEGCDGFALALRLPAWARTYRLTVNGASRVTVMDYGYIFLDGLCAGDVVDYEPDFAPYFLRANPLRDELAGTCCVCAGPVVYAARSEDNPGGLGNLLLDPRRGAEVFSENGRSRLRLPAKRVAQGCWDVYELYAAHLSPEYEEITAVLVPYAEAGEGSRVWLRSEDR